MQTFVTGATGLLGNNLVRALLAEGHTVRALVRSKHKAQRLLADTDAELVQGDMLDVPAFADALTGCEVVFHTAAYFREYYRAGDHAPARGRERIRHPGPRRGGPGARRATRRRYQLLRHHRPPARRPTG